MIHKLKILPHFFHDVREERKTFEVRKNDRDFKIGDELILEEFVPYNYLAGEWPEHYTGHMCRREVTYILRGGQFGIAEDTVILGIKPI